MTNKKTILPDERVLPAEPFDTDISGKEPQSRQEELQTTNEELLAVNQEITSLNEQITEARDYAEAIISTMHEPMLVLDKELRVKSANKSYYNNFGVTEDETRDVFVYELGDRQWNIGGLRNLLENILTGNSSFSDFEITHHFPGTGKKILLLNARRLLQESQDEPLILLAIHDVTEIRKKIYELQKIEKELLRKDMIENRIEKEGLEKAVEERTKELKQVNKELVILYMEKEKRAAELIIANKELAFQNEEKEKRANELIIANKELAFQNEEKEKRANELIIANKELAFQNEDKEKIASELLLANKELSSFTYIASHDLQEPLRKIQIYISRIADNPEQELGEKNKDYFKRIQAAASRMQTLINDLLSYSRISESREEFKSIDLNSIIHNLLQELTMAQTIEATNTTLHLGKLPKIRGIAFQLEQLFTNLIINSIKYSDSNRAPVINIKSVLINGAEVPNETADDTMEYVMITVTDNGIGFEQQYAEKIFQLFQRLHDKQTYSGTGIGLTISKKIVENHNGFIMASSIPDVGTTISIYLPAGE